MCEFSTKLVAWLDRELAPADAAAMEQHIAGCHQCRDRANAYQDVSRAFAEYREEVHFTPAAPRYKRPVILAFASALAAVAAVLFMMITRSPEQVLRIDVIPPPAPAIALRAETSRPSAPVVRAHNVPRRPVEVQNWIPVQPTIQIAIPSDALFAPGAIPDGFAFAADLSLAADGSPALLALRP